MAIKAAAPDGVDAVHLIAFSVPLYSKTPVVTSLDNEVNHPNLDSLQRCSVLLRGCI
jgi:hypothetical protein